MTIFLKVILCRLAQIEVDSCVQGTNGNLCKKAAVSDNDSCYSLQLRNDQGNIYLLFVKNIIMVLDMDLAAFCSATALHDKSS